MDDSGDHSHHIVEVTKVTISFPIKPWHQFGDGDMLVLCVCTCHSEQSLLWRAMKQLQADHLLGWPVSGFWGELGA
jgi:hypothetical protein